MTREELFEAIGEVDEALVEETRAARERAAREGSERSEGSFGSAAPRKRRQGRRAPVALGVILAACVAAAIAIPAVRNVIRGNGTAGSGISADADAGGGEVLTGGAEAADDEAADAGAQPEAADLGPAEFPDEAGSSSADAEARSEMEEAAVADTNLRNDGLAAVSPIELNGCYYEVTDVPEVLARFGLPGQITAEMAGEHISWLRTEGAGYAQAAVREGASAELLAYAPAPCRGVYVVHDDDRYQAAIFCGFVQLDPNMSTEVSELFRVYGVEKAEDIALVCETDWDRDVQIGEAVTDPGEIAFLYEELTVRDSWGNDDFQAIVFDGIPEEEQPEAHAAFADDMRMLRFETADGLRFYLEYYPSYGWLYGQGNLSWYRVEGRLAAWLDGHWG